MHWSWWALATVLVLAAAVSATGDPCSSQTWSDTKCCSSDRADLGAVSEEVLSVNECGSPAVELQWSHSTLREGGHDLKRIFLFSHCINPTNTSSAPSMSTLLYSSARTHLTSSTTLSHHPTLSACTYFGCYEANFGNNIYTFSEVSCTSATTSSIATTIEFYVLETTVDVLLPASTTAVPQFTPPPPTTQPYASQSPTPSTSTVEREREPPSTVIHTPVNALPSPSLSTRSDPPTVQSFLPWLISLLLVAVIATVTTLLCLLATRASISGHRDIMKDVRNMSWNADPWTGNTTKYAADSPASLKDLDMLSLHSVHSVHTEYDYIAVDGKLRGSLNELTVTTTDDPLQSPKPPLQSSTEQESNTEPSSSSSGDSATHSSQTSSGVSTCPSTTRFPRSNTDSSTCTSGTSSSSYLSYGSLYTLFPEQSRSHNGSSGCQTDS